MSVTSGIFLQSRSRSLRNLWLPVASAPGTRQGAGETRKTFHSFSRLSQRPVHQDGYAGAGAGGEDGGAVAAGSLALEPVRHRLDCSLFIHLGTPPPTASLLPSRDRSG